MRLHRHLVAPFVALVLGLTLVTRALAAGDYSDIGYVDQAALSNLPQFVNANRQLAQFKAGLDKKFASEIRKYKSQSDQARVAQSFQNQLAEKQRELVGPLLQRAQVAIAAVASSKSLSVIVDKRIVVLGGQDVTRNVMDLLSGPGDPVPPVSTPPPSTVGYVDQAAIDATPKIKSANDEFAKFQADQQQQAQGKLKAAKTDADRQQVFKDLQKTLLDKKKQSLDPLIDQTRSVIADVAKKKGLVLVIDRSNLIYGGTDITSDVTAALK
jgi:Skp family chaperone for outer membrane proteins